MKRLITLAAACMLAAPLAFAQTTAKDTVLTDEQANAMANKTIYSSDDKRVGEVVSVKRDPSGRVTELHADIGGFMGMGETRVRVMPDQFRVSGDRVILTLNADQAKSLPKTEK